MQPITYSFTNPNPPGCITIDKDTAEVTVLTTGIVDVHATYPEDLFYKKSVITYQLIILNNNEFVAPTCIYQPVDLTAPTVNCDPHTPPVAGGFTLFKGIDYILSASSNSGNTLPIEFKLPSPTSLLVLNPAGADTPMM